MEHFKIKSYKEFLAEIFAACLHPQAEDIHQFIEQESEFNIFLNNLEKFENFADNFEKIIAKFFETNKYLAQAIKVDLTPELKANVINEVNNFILEAIKEFHIEKLNGKLQIQLISNDQSIRDFKRLLKLLATYEIYKILNPKRLAGMTKRENFVNNVRIGGIQRAVKYAGGAKKDLMNYSKNFIERLTKEHELLKKSSKSIRSNY